MAEASINIVGKDVMNKLTKMASNAGDLRGILMRSLYPIYQNAQRSRWMTENASEGKRWKSLAPTYAKRKLIVYGGGKKHKFIGGRPLRGEKFDSTGRPRPWEEKGVWKSYPGRGTKMMIATGRLQQATIGPGKGQRVMATKNSLIIRVTTPYAEHANRARDFSHFGQKTIDQMKDVLKKYVVGK